MSKVTHTGLSHRRAFGPSAAQVRVSIRVVHDRLDAPRMIDAAMNREVFDLDGETRRAPTLHGGYVVMLDNHAIYRSPQAAAIPT